LFVVPLTSPPITVAWKQTWPLLLSEVAW